MEKKGLNRDEAITLTKGEVLKKLARLQDDSKDRVDVMTFGCCMQVAVDIISSNKDEIDKAGILAVLSVGLESCDQLIKSSNI